jgi:hypothetical protein
MTDDLHKISQCRRSPVKGMANDASADRVPSSCGPARLCHRHGGQHATTTDAPTRARTSTPTLTPRRSSGGRRRTLPAAMLLHGCPEAAISEERRVCQ